MRNPAVETHSLRGAVAIIIDPVSITPAPTTIRPEQTGDAAAIAGVVTAAFGSPVEAQLVADIRASAHFVPAWSLVAVDTGDDREIVGHVMASFAELEDGDVRHRVPTLSPLAVTPHRQREGIGSALVRALVARVDETGEPLMVLEGDPRYYGRLGFEHATPLGIAIDLPDWAPPEADQVRRLRAYRPEVRGSVVYPPAFAAAIADH